MIDFLRDAGNGTDFKTFTFELSRIFMNFRES
jgi:hypothetical protein